MTKDLSFLCKQKILPADCLWTQLQVFPGSPVCRPTLQILDLPSLHDYVSQFLKICIYLSTYLSSLLLGCFSGEPWLIQELSIPTAYRRRTGLRVVKASQSDSAKVTKPFWVQSYPPKTSRLPPTGSVRWHKTPSRNQDPPVLKVPNSHR